MGRLWVVNLFGSLFNKGGAPRARGRGGSGGGFRVLGCSNVHTRHVNGLPCTVGYFRRTITVGSRLRALDLLTATCARTGQLSSTHVALSHVTAGSPRRMGAFLSLTNVYCVRRSCRGVGSTYRGTLILSGGGPLSFCLATGTTVNVGSSVATVTVLAGTVMLGRSCARTCRLHTRML